MGVERCVTYVQVSVVYGSTEEIPMVELRVILCVCVCGGGHWWMCVCLHMRVFLNLCMGLVKKYQRLPPQEQFRAMLTKVSTLDMLLDDLKEAGMCPPA